MKNSEIMLYKIVKSSYLHVIIPITAMLLLLFPLGISAQVEKAEKLVELAQRDVTHCNFNDAARKYEEALKQKLTVDKYLEYGLQLYSIYHDNLNDESTAHKCLQMLHEKAEKMIRKTKEKVCVSQLTNVILGLAQDAVNQDDIKQASSYCDCALRLIDQVEKRGLLEPERGVVEAKCSRSLVHFMRATMQQNQALYAQANEDFEKAVAFLGELKDEKDPIILRTQGIYLFCHTLMHLQDTHDWQKALMVAEHFIPFIQEWQSIDNDESVMMMRQDVPNYILALAKCYFKTENYEEALRYCDEAWTWASETLYKANVTDLRGQILVKQNRYEEARKCWEEVKQLLPTFYQGEGTQDGELRKMFGQ